MSTDIQPSVACSFCGKRQDEVERLIAGPDAFEPTAFICGGCIGLCSEILDEGEEPPVVMTTVTGELERSALGGWLVIVDDFLGADLNEGDTVEVMIRKRETGGRAA
jgi:hypothetical protein